MSSNNARPATEATAYPKNLSGETISHAFEKFILSRRVQHTPRGALIDRLRALELPPITSWRDLYRLIRVDASHETIIVGRLLWAEFRATHDLPRTVIAHPHDAPPRPPHNPEAYIITKARFPLAATEREPTPWPRPTK
ncbi:hypothetical protein QNJ95_42690 [Bradyrhizobium elkanii]|uniref:hypothetical protein n=1 Tax=Bradyrhizobium TaxID=374 RepID=UPI0027120EB6|nr:hypothetical protein [Bradyrhizobium elkanii]WLA39479.1 hypothetical protein QNJ95_42690 [Bradyrhizobium elkanii]